MVTTGSWWRSAQKRLTEGGQAPAPQEAREIIRHVLKLDGMGLMAREHEELPAGILAVLDDLLARRMGGKPLGYVLGGAWFMGRWWPVGPGVLIPRPDTEVLVQAALERLPARGIVVDVGLGSGAVLGTLLLERDDVSGVGVELDPAVALQAAASLGRFGLDERVEIMAGSLLEPLQGMIDMVVSNPPYISAGEWAGLEPVVRDFEPRLALVGAQENADGLAVYRDLLPQAFRQLRSGGWLVIEIGWQQAAAVRELLALCAWNDISIIKDLAERDRVVCARRG